MSRDTSKAQCYLTDGGRINLGNITGDSDLLKPLEEVLRRRHMTSNKQWVLHINKIFNSKLQIN